MRSRCSTVWNDRAGLLKTRSNNFFWKRNSAISDGWNQRQSRELLEQFRYQNEKVKLDYALIKPEDLEAKITPGEAEIKAAYEKRKSQDQIPEKRVVEYGLVDLTKLRQTCRFPTTS